MADSKTRNTVKAVSRAVAEGIITATGTLDTSGTDLVFGDNDKAVFGAGSDLQIYHDGVHSYVADAGGGSLILSTNGTTVSINTDGPENMAVFTKDGSVDLYYNNNKKFETADTGVYVTGSVNANATSGRGGASTGHLFKMPSGDIYFEIMGNAAGSNTDILFSDGTGGSYGVVGYDHTNDAMRFFSNSGERMRIDSSGNVGIGTSSPAYKLDIQGTSDPAQIRLKEDGNTNGFIIKNYDGDEAQLVNADNGPMVFKTNDLERMRITSDGNVGIGTNSPAVSLQVKASSPAVSLQASASKTSGSRADFNAYNSDVSTVGYIRFGAVTDNVGTDIQFANRPVGGSLTERVRIDSSGRLLLGTTTAGESSADDLTIATTGQTGITIRSGTANAGSIYFSDGTSGTSQYSGYIFYDHNVNALAMGTNAVERLRIDSSGRVLTYKTSAGLANPGIEHNFTANNGYLGVTSTGTTAYFNREDTDGTILEFRKDNSTAGSIGGGSGFLTIGSSTGNLAFFTGLILPTASSSGATSNGVIDLGNSSNRFKDLYLSGGVYLGGTGSANLLDDYEEGTWTPTFQASTDPTVTYATRYGKYTKIGSLVTCLCILTTDGVSGGSGALKITGLPFAEEATVGTSVIGHAWSGEIPMKIRISSSSAFLYYRSSIHASDINNNTQVSDMATGSGGNNRIEFTITYTTAS